jgi:hypothetical protein
VVIGAAVLLFIASFLDTYDSSGSDIPNAWDNLGLVMSTYVGGIIGAVLIILARSLPQPRKVVGLDLGQVGVSLTVFAAWTAFWTIIDPVGPVRRVGLRGRCRLRPHPRPDRHPGPGRRRDRHSPGPGPPGRPRPRPQAGRPAALRRPAARRLRLPGCRCRCAAALVRHAAAAGAGRAAVRAAAPAPAPAGDFSPFWFAVPVARPLFGEDGSPSPIAELAPGTWYLAVEQRGPALVAQTQDGRRGVLQDTSGIQRG